MVEGRLPFCRRLRRKRAYDTEGPETSTLRRCLNRWDVTALGVGSTLGIGVYVTIGLVALKLAGPSVVLSFLLAAVVALLAGLCYAEFGSRVPLAGSSYIYAYVTFGELVGFLVGWNNIFEFVFGAASVARGLSLYIDVLANNTISAWCANKFPIGVPLLSSNFDLLAFLIVIVFGALLAVGARESVLVNNILASVNVLTVLFIIVAGSLKANSANWKIEATQVPEGFGDGGFFPYGMWGTLKGVAVCFYAFAAFDVLNSSGEEVKNPRRALPAGILSMLLVMFIAYTGISIVITMMVPYYELTLLAPLSSAFSHVGWDWVWWIIACGSVLGICSSLFGVLFSLTRLVYSMSTDGFLIHWFSKVTSNKKSPIIATATCTFIIAVLSAIVDLEQLVLMMCIGTLGSYTIVAIGVVLLSLKVESLLNARLHTPRSRCYTCFAPSRSIIRYHQEKNRYQSNYVSVVRTSFLKQVIGRGDKVPTHRSKQIINIAMTLYVILCLTIAVVIIHTTRPLAAIITLHLLAVLTVLVMALQPTCKEDMYFKTPLVPLLPCISIYANIHLMVIINWHTWLRVLTWLLIGIPIYLFCVCCYTQIASKEEDGDDIINPFANKNGKSVTVKIVVESPTPPSTVARCNSYGDRNEENDIKSISDIKPIPVAANKTEEIIIQQIQIENNEEKEAKIIDLLDQVLQAEEDSYGEVISLKDNKEEDAVFNSGDDESNIPHRKSLSELSDAGSDASLGNQVLSKYDVIAQVHREDLPKVNEEEEERGNHLKEVLDDDEDITLYNDSDSNSRTDESGYSDTIDRQPLSDSLEDNNDCNKPVPSQFDESYFSRSTHVADSEAVDKAVLSGSSEEANDFHIPVPPPFDENYFSNSTPIIPNLQKYNTIAARQSKMDLETDEDNVSEPRVSLQSNNSQGDAHVRFGSSRQIKLMTKLNDIFKKRLDNEEETPKKRRSQSTGNVVEAELAVAESKERPQIFLDLKKELLSRESLPYMRPVNTQEKEMSTTPEPGESDEQDEEKSMSREDLKSKLESIFSIGGPQLLAKPRLMKSSPPTPEDSYHTDISSAENTPKLPKMGKNDTLRRQKEKFGLVLNSIRLSYKGDEV